MVHFRHDLRGKVRHTAPAIGAAVGEMLANAGCFVRDRVEERSRWTYPDFERNANLHAALDRATASGVLARTTADAWLAEQQQRASEGDFIAEIAKILWVATTPPN